MILISFWALNFWFTQMWKLLFVIGQIDYILLNDSNWLSCSSRLDGLQKKLQIWGNENYNAKNQTLITLKSCHFNHFLIGYYKVSFYMVAKINLSLLSHVLEIIFALSSLKVKINENVIFFYCIILYLMQYKVFKLRYRALW